MAKMYVKKNTRDWYMYFDRNTSKEIKALIKWRLVNDSKYEELQMEGQ